MTALPLTQSFNSVPLFHFMHLFFLRGTGGTGALNGHFMVPFFESWQSGKASGSPAEDNTFCINDDSYVNLNITLVWNSIKNELILRWVTVEGNFQGMYYIRILCNSFKLRQKPTDFIDSNFDRLVLTSRHNAHNLNSKAKALKVDLWRVNSHSIT